MSFSTIQPKIQKLVEDDPSKVKDVITFASLTIRQPFYTMKKQMTSVKLHGKNSPYLFGFKAKTYEWLQDNADMVKDLPNMIKKLTDEEALGILTTIPGIGLAKGGFIMQLISGKGGCIDSHNMLLYKDTIVSTLKEYNISMYNKSNIYIIKINIPLKIIPLRVNH